jgi:hypothetical protein
MPPRPVRRRAGSTPNGYRARVARKKLPPVDPDEAKTIGALLRALRRAAGFRAVQDAVADPHCPAARQTVYAYERGGLVPSLAQFLELVEFYALRAEPGPDAKPIEDLRSQAVVAVVTALTMPCYHMTEAMRLMAQLQPPPSPSNRRHPRSE